MMRKDGPFSPVKMKTMEELYEEYKKHEETIDFIHENIGLVADKYPNYSRGEIAKMPVFKQTEILLDIAEKVKEKHEKGEKQ